MSSPHIQPLPKPPMERTLLVAITILSVVALVQIVATGLALVPRIDFDKIGRSFGSRTAAAPGPAAAPAAAPAPSAEASTQANTLLGEAQKFRDAGNFQGALEAVTEADRLVPNKPGILIQMAADSHQLGKTPETLAILRRIIALPPGADAEDEAFRKQAQSALDQLGGAASGPAADAPAAASADKPALTDGMRDDIGIPVGSVMGIVDVKLLDGEPGIKNLRVSTKGSSATKVDPLKFQATVDFYEQDDQGEIQHNDSPRPNEWLSGPLVDWADNTPEIFQVKYRLPLQDRGDLPPLQYYGYVVAIYYNGELQDQRAEPSALLDKFAPPLHKDLATE